MSLPFSAEVVQDYMQREIGDADHLFQCTMKDIETRIQGGVAPVQAAYDQAKAYAEQTRYVYAAIAGTIADLLELHDFDEHEE